LNEALKMETQLLNKSLKVELSPQGTAW